jgi:hypothetical protein
VAGLKFKLRVRLVVFGLLVVSLSVLLPAQAQYTADGQGFILVSPIAVESPKNTTYATNQVCLNFSVKSYFHAYPANPPDTNITINPDASIAMTYSIDGKDNVTIPTSERLVPVWADVTYANGTKTKKISSTLSYYLTSGLVELEDLQQGQHCLTVFARYSVHSMQKTAFDNQTVYFTIDASSPIVAQLADGAPESEPSNNIIYASAGVFSLIAVAVVALFTKRKQRDEAVS